LVDTNTKEYAMLKAILGEDETVDLEIIEHRLGGARLLEPAHAFATNQGIIIIRKGVLGFHRDFKIIRYDAITEVRLERGPLFCKMHFSLQGEQSESEDSQKWLVGLRYNDAIELTQFVNKIIEMPVKEIK